LRANNADTLQSAVSLEWGRIIGGTGLWGEPSPEMIETAKKYSK
jgi:hypothetical protein